MSRTDFSPMTAWRSRRSCRCTRSAVAVGSFSKSLSLAGERIGYIAVSPAMPQADLFVAGLILCNRILGYVNAPVIGQRLVEAALGATVDVGIYKSRRDAMAAILRDAGIEFALPTGRLLLLPQGPRPSGRRAILPIASGRIGPRGPRPRLRPARLLPPDLLHGRGHHPPRRPGLQKSRRPRAKQITGKFELQSSKSDNSAAGGRLLPRAVRETNSELERK